MKSLPLRQPVNTKGQGLAEYALLIALVAVVVVVIAFGVGLATQRIFGIVVGSLDATGKDVKKYDITILRARCIAHWGQNIPQGLTGIEVTGTTTATDLNVLTGSTNLAVGTGMDSDGDGVANSSPVEANGANGFVWHPLLVMKADPSVCPRAVVIQADDGSMAAAPIEVVEVR